jgi:hypothetical protein
MCPSIMEKPGFGAGGVMDVAAFLGDLSRHLIRSGSTSRQIAALEFAAEGRDINVRACRERRGAYPDLGTIMGCIGPALRAQGVAVRELRRLTFHDTGIGLELVGADGRVRTRSWPLVNPADMDVVAAAAS